MLAVAAPGKQACTVTTIRWKLSADVDPFVKETVDQVCAWIDMWPELKVMKNMAVNMKESWNKALSAMYISGVNWRRVTGPISATIAATNQQQPSVRGLP